MTDVAASGDPFLANPIPQDPLVIIGPTASGKSSLALEVASAVEAEIVSADAMAVYRGMDIGTAKPTPQEQARVPHHLVDVAEPADDYTVSLFKEQVDAALADIKGRGHPAVLVGGTGLYVRAIVDNLTLPGRFPAAAAEVEAERNTEALWHRLLALDPVAAEKMEPTNRRRIVRALEVCLGSGQPFSSFGPGLESYPNVPFVQVGIEIERDVMDERINARYDQQMAAGFLDEVARVRSGPMGRTASQALGYRELMAHLNGDIDLATALDEAKTRTRRFARRQQRWFRRDPRITWFPHDVEDLASQVVAHWKNVGTGAPEVRDSSS